MRTIIAVVGPTAVGKSELGIRIAQHLQGEVISGDAFQFYRGMDIGTAKMLEADWRSIRHHLIDILNPEDPFSVADYQKAVRAKIDELLMNDITPVLVGGSGLYISAVLYDYQFIGAKRTIDQDIDKLANGELWNFLNSLSPEVANITDRTNRRRLLRAIELSQSEDAPFENTSMNPYYPDFKVIGLEMDRPVLYKAIEERVDLMVNNGLVAEVKAFYDRNLRSQAMAAIGYKELFAYFDGKMSLEEAILAIKQQSRRFAKRQMTWFKNKMQATWFKVDRTDFEATVQAVLDHLG